METKSEAKVSDSSYGYCSDQNCQRRIKSSKGEDKQTQFANCVTADMKLTRWPNAVIPKGYGSKWDSHTMSKVCQLLGQTLENSGSILPKHKCKGMRCIKQA